MSELSATGNSTVIASGFSASGDRDKSEGRGGYMDLGYFTELDEAIDAARGQGVQGDDGYVSLFESRLFEGGLVHTVNHGVISRRRVPDGSYLVGFMDMREYEFGVRPADAGPVRPVDNSIWNREKFVIPEEDAASVLPIGPGPLRSLLVADPLGSVGVWRRVGNAGWRGEFPGGTDAELNRWLPARAAVDRLAEVR